ncbi:MAG: biotin/lipoyl-binding protein [Phycisphaerales bacterium]
MLFRYSFLVLALGGILLALRVVRASEQTTPPAQPVASPSGPPFPSYVAGSGIIEASSRNIAVGSPVAGTVEAVFVEAGTPVTAGDPLFRLDTRQLRAQLAVATAAVDSANANLRRLESLPRPEDVAPLNARVAEAEALLADAKSRLAMWDSIEDKRAVTRDELDRRRFAVTVAEARLADAQATLATTLAGAWAPDLAISRAQVEAAKAEQQRVQTEIERLVVRSPVDGEVLQLNIRLGEFATAGVVATPLVLLGTVDPLHVRVDVDENDAWRVAGGAGAVAFLRGNTALRTDLRFVRFEPFVVPKKSLTGDSTERVDTRVLQVIYAFDRKALPAYVGQQVDVFIDAPNTPATPLARADQ